MCARLTFPCTRVSASLPVVQRIRAAPLHVLLLPRPVSRQRHSTVPCAGNLDTPGPLSTPKADASNTGSKETEQRRDISGEHGSHPQQALLLQLARSAHALVAAALYNTGRAFESLKQAYFSWRRDSTSDALALTGVLMTFVLTGAALRRALVDDDAERAVPGGYWHDVYMVCQWVFGQQFPSSDVPAPQQACAVLTAVAGLCVFALLLALVEQVVLDWMDAHVKRGTEVYGSGHVRAQHGCGFHTVFNSTCSHTIYILLNQQHQLNMDTSSCCCCCSLLLRTIHADAAPGVVRKPA